MGQSSPRPSGSATVSVAIADNTDYTEAFVTMNLIEDSVIHKVALRVFQFTRNNTLFAVKVVLKLEITCHDGKPDGMLRVERRRYGSAPDVSRGVSDRRTDT